MSVSLLDCELHEGQNHSVWLFGVCSLVTCP